MDENNRIFNGIWIPKEIYLNKELTWTEKILLCEIGSLCTEEGCSASNEYFADFLGVTERLVQLALAKLKNLGYVSYVSFDGRTRLLKSNIKIEDVVSWQTRNKFHPCGEIDCRSGENLLYNSRDNNILNNNINNNIISGNNNKGVIGGKEKGGDLSLFAEKQPQNQSQKSDPKRFVKPTLEEVKAYVDEKNYNFEPEVFIDFYESNGWMVGKNHMKDWKAAVRTWGAKHGKKKSNEYYY